MDNKQTLLMALAVASLALGLATNAHAAVILAWDFDFNKGLADPVNATTEDPNLQTTAITRSGGVGGVTAVAVNDSFSATDWATGARPDTGNYFEFTITLAGGYQYTITDIVSTVYPVFPGNGPTGWELRSSRDGYVASLGPAPNGNGVTVATLRPLSFSGLTTTPTFRLNGYKSTGGSGLAGGLK